MKKLFLMLLIAFMLFPSCQENKMYNAFLDKKGRKVVQLVEKDDTDKIAYLAMFQYSNKDSILKMSKDIAQYYNIEGYDMFIGDSLFYFISEEMKDRGYTLYNSPTEMRIAPYQYRNEYVNNGDTIARIIKRDISDGRKAAILTDKKYSRKDTTLLKKIIDFFYLDKVYIWDSISTKIYFAFEEDEIFNAYSFYQRFTDEFFFWDEATEENRFSINGAHVLNIGDSRLFIKYRTNRFLTSREILQIKQEKLNAKWKDVVYFYTPNDDKKDYASIHYNKEKNEYTIFMFNEKKTYIYNASKDSWSSNNHQ